VTPSKAVAVRAGNVPEYVLLEFQQQKNMRLYSFQGRAPENKRLDFVVEVDLGLLFRYRIPMQSVPLLCRRLLEAKPVLEQARRIVFGEGDMRAFAERLELEKREAEARRKTSFRPVQRH
jgi:hypothetical protein